MNLPTLRTRYYENLVPFNIFLLNDGKYYIFLLITLNRHINHSYIYIYYTSILRALFPAPEYCNTTTFLISYLSSLLLIFLSSDDLAFAFALNHSLLPNYLIQLFATNVALLILIKISLLSRYTYLFIRNQIFFNFLNYIYKYYLLLSFHMYL